MSLKTLLSNATKLLLSASKLCIESLMLRGLEQRRRGVWSSPRYCAWNLVYGLFLCANAMALIRRPLAGGAVPKAEVAVDFRLNTVWKWLALDSFEGGIPQEDGEGKSNKHVLAKIMEW